MARTPQLIYSSGMLIDSGKAAINSNCCCGCPTDCTGDTSTYSGVVSGVGGTWGCPGSNACSGMNQTYTITKASGSSCLWRGSGSGGWRIEMRCSDPFWGGWYGTFYPFGRGWGPGLAIILVIVLLSSPRVVAWEGSVACRPSSTLHQTKRNFA